MPETAAGMLDDLLRLPHELVLTQSFAFVDRQPTLDRMNLALRRMKAADDEALRVDHNPLLLDLGRLGRKGFHVRIP